MKKKMYICGRGNKYYEKEKGSEKKKILRILKNYECQNIKTSWKVRKSPRKVTKKKNKNKNRK